jgi:uncharacterized membrane protein YecN with MAPEG domain
MPVITALYAGLLGLMSIAIAFLAGRLRGKLNVSIGDGGHRELLLAMRRHANFAEYVPIALILIALLEMNGVSRIAVHALGAALVVARACHAVGLEADSMSGAGRFVGAAGTALVVVVASVWSIACFF